MVTVRDCCLKLQAVLTEYGVEEADLEARELTAAACGLNARDTWNWKHISISEEQQKTADAFLARRQKQEPLAYILGEWDFYGNTFCVTPDVLIPRSDTEWLCDAAVQCARQMKTPRVLDLCCGSGCIGISIALAVPDARVTALDYSQAALTVTRENAQRHALPTERFSAVHGNALIPDSIAGEFDIVVSNPPYITQQEMQELDESVSAYEPHLALFGGTDGLDFYRVMAQTPPFSLRHGGMIFLECGWKQGQQVEQLFRNADWKQTEVRCDLSGIPRIVCAVRA